MKLLKKILSVTLSVSLLAGACLSPKFSQAAKKIKLSKTKVTLKVGKTTTLKLKKGSKAIKKGIKWKSSKKGIATVSSKGKIKAVKKGSAVITATYKKKKYKCKVTVKKDSASVVANSALPDDTASPDASASADTSASPDASSSPSNSSTPVNSSNPVQSSYPSVSASPNASETPTESTTPVVADDFDFDKDVSITYGTETKTVKFTIDESVVTKQELEEMGYTIDGNEATKDTVCETATYTFNKLPSSLDSIKSFFTTKHDAVDPTEYKNHDEETESSELCYGGFNCMAATICSACTFKGGSNPSDPFFSKDPVREMFEYLNGPNLTLAKSTLDNSIDSMKNAINSCGENVYKSYFDGATIYNNYTPSTPYVLKMYRGPYYIPSKKTINGTRPTTYMIFAQSNGADDPVYMDVYYSKVDERWYSYQDQFRHVIANNFQTPEIEL